MTRSELLHVEVVHTVLSSNQGEVGVKFRLEVLIKEHSGTVTNHILSKLDLVYTMEKLSDCCLLIQS